MKSPPMPFFFLSFWIWLDAGKKKKKKNSIGEGKVMACGQP
jgi:hypothetical protein